MNPKFNILFILALSMLVFAGCQKMPRDNPFDPGGVCIPQDLEVVFNSGMLTDTVEWSPVKNALEYELYSYTTMMMMWTLVKTTTITTSAVINVTASGSQYRVRAKIGGIYSAFSETVTSQ